MKSERGISLIELIVYSMLLAVVLALVGGLLINSLVTDRKIRDSTQASSSGQVAGESLSHGVRDAYAVRASAASGDPQTLMALIVTDALASPVQSHCAAWYYGGGEIRTTRSNSLIPMPTTAADVAGWTVLATGVEPVGGAPVFLVDETNRSVDFTMQLSTGTGLKVLIETTAVSRQPALPPTGSVTCF